VILGKLFDELKRRNVFRVAVAYIVSAWLVLQVADVVINNIGAPDWVFSVFMLGGGLLFLPVLFFSWAYELTPEGIKKESEVDRDGSITDRTGRKLNLITIAMLVSVVAFVLFERTMSPPSNEVVATDEVVAEVTMTTVDDKSIAVLAFDDLSPGGDQAFFAEGLSEEILNVLAQVPGLKVAGRTSSFAFQGSDTDLREIGEALNVAHILEGSVRKAGDRIRVTAQLIQASDGFHLFSRTYDRDLVDVFAVQDEIAALISTALKAELSDSEVGPTSTPTNLETYDLYLLARQRIHSRDPELMREAIELLDKALEIDPNYAPALAQRALALGLMSDRAYGDIPDAMTVEEGLALIERALEIDPQLPEAHAIFGLITYELPGRTEEAVERLRYALELNPNMDDGKNWLANATDDLDESIELYEQVLLRDPLYGPAFNNLTQSYLDLGDFDKSEALIDRITRITGRDANVRQALGSMATMRGDLSSAVRDLDYAFNANPNAAIVRVWQGFALTLIGEWEQVAMVGDPSQKITALSVMGDFDAVDALIDEEGIDAGRNRVFQIQAIAEYLVARGRATEMVDIVNENYVDLNALLADFSGTAYYGTQYLGSLALAYSRAGIRDESQLIVEKMRWVLDQKRVRGSDNWIFWHSEAQYATLSGDAEAAIANLEKAIEKGMVSVGIFEPQFDSIRSDKRFAAIEAELLSRANKERAKLGMSPYEPPMLFD
jgi:TolB-like protein/Tfp pilus assembly protein PilF